MADAPLTTDSAEMIAPLEVQEKFIAILARFDDCAVPRYQLQLFKEEMLAGEPVVAFEDFCSQLFEYDVSVSKETQDQLRELGLQLNITPDHWTDLTVK